MDNTRPIGPVARTLGYAGLLPQVAVVVMLVSGDVGARYVALALGFAYAALILSFLGGIWWGLAAAAPGRAPRWLWVAAIAPSLVALASAWPWMVGLSWPEPSLVALGIVILATLAVDHHAASARAGVTQPVAAARSPVAGARRPDLACGDPLGLAGIL